MVDCLSKPDVNMSQWPSSPSFSFFPSFCRSHPTLYLGDLRKLAWAGLPAELRPIAWPLLLGYLPLNHSSRLATLARKREEYASLVELTFSPGGKEGLDQQIWHQIEIDVPRTRPGVRLWMEAGTQRVSLSPYMTQLYPLTKGLCDGVEFRANTIRLGHTASSKRICARN